MYTNTAFVQTYVICLEVRRKLSSVITYIFFPFRDMIKETFLLIYRMGIINVTVSVIKCQRREYDSLFRTLLAGFNWFYVTCGNKCVFSLWLGMSYSLV